MTSDRNRDTGPAGGGSFDSAGDATRRTHLANERTYLAWWRTGLACMAGSLGVPALTSGSETLAIVAGVIFGLLAISCFVYGLVRYQQVNAAVHRGEYVRPDARMLAALAGVGIILALLVVAIVLVDA
ncbi:DUF202 domain-containing protein [Conexibacter sp. JD483]|uniref:YidH family protein n=1 Tax=unclassified Conexibacter TaxID=2627773 RepID=UPI002723C8F9|nr:MULTISPECIES: DUF202 domain-containing protein [unclassified Conexibacter]MDO8188659.1 DUF202 domain-containing protein [Conexibacter sp. CPCC 205706]MDO8199368.1 DUF202 domain-containing protein [Conexibacter sp. CPCC 205762]MDR9370832.1 DUF202 domain-containing protein [Conexibacter sp. JD483]